MKTFWITSRIESNASYDERYLALQEAIRQHSTRWWTESTSFYLFESASSIEDIARAVKPALGKRDIALLGMIGFKGNWVVGPVSDNDLFTLIPNVKAI